MVEARPFDRFTGSAIFTTAVNKPRTVKIKGPLEAAAARVLRGVPGLSAEVERDGRKRSADAVLEFAGTRMKIVVEFKDRANAATAWQLVRYAEAHLDKPLLLVARETTAETRRILEEHGIGVVDGLGNAHVEQPGLLFHRDGRHRHERRAAGRPATRVRGKAGVVAQALLLQPERTWHVHDLAAEAGVSPPLAHRVLARLEDEGVVAPEGAGPKRVRRVAEPAALLDLWAEEQADKETRTTAYLLAQTPAQLVNELGTNLGAAGIDYALTGAAGASLVAPFITAIPVAEVWVEATAGPEDLYDGARADPVAEGHNVAFLQAKDDTPLAFRERVRGLWVANRFRLYRDLLRDPRRGREQADHLRREVIGF